MRKRLFIAVAVLLGVLPIISLAAPAPASAAPDYGYSGPYFGENNFPPGCVRSMSPDDPTNVCFHMRTGLNALDSPQIDVLVLVPVSPTAERDMRIMRQSVEMWESGIDYLAKQMDLPWLADGVNFHITVDYVDLTGEGNGGELTTYPVVDPEIVIIATNPVGGIGIGIDPVAEVASLVIEDENAVPCHNIPNPFDFEYWENLPGFDSHHEAREGIYTEDCGGAGGNVCFAINGAIDPAPEQIDFFNLFDLVSHEFGHCLTLGHVGDGAEGEWGVLPSNDIMAYNTDPPGKNKCVSTLDVEGFALRMSHYLDVNGDGEVGDADHLEANDQIGEGANAFQVQHPADHLYASSTGKPGDCPQPDLGLVPGERTDWTPTPQPLSSPELTVTSPDDGTTLPADAGPLTVTGTVDHRSLLPEAPTPTSPSGSYDDPDDDATTPVTEITSFDTTVTATTVETTLHLADIWASTDVTSPVSYSVIIDGKQFDSFVRYPGVDANPVTWDGGAYMPEGTSTWDTDAKTVTFHIPREALAGAGITSPYWVKASANFGGVGTTTADDVAPDEGDGVGVAYARTTPITIPDVHLGDTTETTTVEFEHEGGNTFYPEDSQPDEGIVFDNAHVFALDIPSASDVDVTLAWDDASGTSDLDLKTAGAADAGSDGATQNNPEHVVLEGVSGRLDLQVIPYLITNPLGVTYTLTAKVTPVDPATADSDRDGVVDATDTCPLHPGTDSDGCPHRDEYIVVYVDGARAAAANVETIAGADHFSVPVNVEAGTHDLRIAWEDEGEVVAEQTLSVTREADDPPAGDPPAGDPPAGDPPAGDPPPAGDDHPTPPPAAGDHPAPPARSGYWMLGSTGKVFAFGDATDLGDAPVGQSAAVDLEPTPSRDGYWVVDAAGHVFAFGDASYLGAAGGLTKGETVTSMSSTSTGRGYWLFTTKGRVLAFGDADHFGDMSDTPLNGPVLDSIPTPSGRGYYMVASDGGVFTFGDAHFVSSMGGKHLNAPVQSLVPDTDGIGYWLVAGDGGIFSFDAGFHGSMGAVKLNKPITGMVGSSTGAGYLMVGADGGIFTFGDVAFHGSLGADPPAFPITSVAGV